MTFMEMIAQLDDKHKARCKSWENKRLYICAKIDEYSKLTLYYQYRHYGTQEFAFCKDDFLATDWILEEI